MIVTALHFPLSSQRTTGPTLGVVAALGHWSAVVWDSFGVSGVTFGNMDQHCMYS